MAAADGGLLNHERSALSQAPLILRDLSARYVGASGQGRFDVPASWGGGIALKASDRLTLAAGYGGSDDPMRSSQTLLNILAPGVFQQHLTAGATWTSEGGVEVTGFVLHALNNTVHGNGSIPPLFGGGEADISLAGTSVGLSVGWKY